MRQVDWLEAKGADVYFAKQAEKWTGESQREAQRQLQVARTESSALLGEQVRFSFHRVFCTETAMDVML